MPDCSNLQSYGLITIDELRSILIKEFRKSIIEKSFINEVIDINTIYGLDGFNSMNSFSINYRTTRAYDEAIERIKEESLICQINKQPYVLQW